MERLDIRLLGGFEVLVDGELAIDFESATTKALLARLAADPGHPVSRALLAELLWPGREQGAARANLRHALASLRRTIGDRSTDQRVLLADAFDVRLEPGPDLMVDLVRFQDLAAASPVATGAVEAWEAAARLVRGPFLAGFDLAAGESWNEWMRVTRAHIEFAATDVLARLIDHHGSAGNHALACRYAEGWIEIDPWNERAHRLLLRHLVADGRRGDAILHAERLIARFSSDLGTKPDPETEMLVDTLRT